MGKETRVGEAGGDYEPTDQQEKEIEHQTAQSSHGHSGIEVIRGPDCSALVPS